MQMSTRLTRSRSDRMIAGVGAGIARYLNTDPTLVRLVFVLITLSGPGVFIYALLWILMPEEAPVAGPGAPGQVMVATGETVRLRIDPAPGGDEHEVPISNVGGAAPGAAPTPSAQGGKVLGYLLLGLGLFITLQMVWPGFTSFLFPAALVAAGFWLLRKG